jgi:phosphatidylglycerol:prolipoprotein diacylglycerol transferase
MLQHGGLSWYGGFACGTLSGILYVKKHNLALKSMLDLFAPYLALGQAIGRVGCFLNGCCFGKLSRFGLYFPSQNNTLIPTQLYSSLILFLIFVFLKFVTRRPHPEGKIFLLYLLLYSIKRFFIEFLRADNPAIFMGLTLFQLISLVIFIFSASRLFYLANLKNKNAGI